MDLHARITCEGPLLVPLNGLFRSNENLGTIARPLAEHFTVYGLDLRNHGRSPHGRHMDYPTLATDVRETLDAHALERLPRARVATVNGAAHWVHVEAPSAFPERVQSFLATPAR